MVGLELRRESVEGRGTHSQLVFLILHNTPRSIAFQPSSLTEREDTPHSSPLQMGGLLSAATAPPLTSGAELETGLK